MINLKKTIITSLLIVMAVTFPVQAEVKLNALLTCAGLTQQGYPAAYRSTFSLNQDRGVQYYAAWQKDNQQHQVAVKWFNPQGQLISQLTLRDFSQGIVRDYISFSERTKTQYFIPKQVGVYNIYLYIDGQLEAVTEFEVTE